ncbi:MAG: 16S rRNA (cytosine(967)-C(5))-methyltransferase RsmB [Betaproteobacteria bacterium]|nr:16S rRNA (cytosine(967)-C(5))-methyltransferase RsmB [Betaproteobacteria bacterium]
MTDARALAARLINHVLLEHRSLSQALAESRAEDGDAPARASAANLAYGVLRRAGSLRYYLSRLTDRPLRPPELLGTLLTGLHELELGETPAYAVVHATVELAARRQPAARGFANAVLRNFQRRREELAAEAERVPEARWNFPAWWLRRLRQEYPEAWESIVRAQNTPPCMSLRVNRRRASPEERLAALDAAGIAARRTGPWALTLERPLPVAELPGFAAGLLSVQDVGAQWAAPLLDARDGLRVLDACAAPGGKTGHLLELADLDLLALDNDATRLRRVRENLDRLGLAASLQVADAGEPAAWWDGRPFDRILLDAPCTASGVARRHPDGKWLKRAEDMQQLAQEQARLLEALWPLLKPGGTMLYATCSLFRAENQEPMTAFAARHADARLDLPELPGARAGQLLPGPDTDGFFYARLHKT